MCKLCAMQLHLRNHTHALTRKFNQKNTYAKTSNAQSLSMTLKGFHFNLHQFLAWIAAGPVT